MLSPAPAGGGRTLRRTSGRTSGLPWAALAWAAVAAGASAAVAPFEPNLLEEGILLHVAQRIAHGERLYRDVLAFTGPLPFEALALLFRVFGESVFVGRAAVALMQGAATAAAFAIARRAGAGPLAHPAAAAYALAPLLFFPLFGIFYYTTFAFHLSVLALWAALRGERSARWAFVAGVGVAAVALCKQPIGVALAVFAGLALLAGPGRAARLGAFAGGGAALAAATVGALFATGTLPAALHALVVLPASLEETFEAPFPNLWPPGEFSPVVAKSQTFYLPYFYVLIQGLFVEPGPRIMLATQALYALPLAALAATALRRARGPLPRAAWLHTALLLTWLTNLYPRTDWGHLVHVLPPAVAQLCLLAARPAAARAGHAARTGTLLAAARKGTVLAAAALTLGLALGAGWALRQIRHVADPHLLSRRVPLHAVSLGLRGVPVWRVIDFLERHTRPGDPIFVARAEPLIYFATRTRNPTPYPGVIPGLREEQARTIVDALGEVRYVVMSDVDQPAMTYYRDELPAVQAYLERHFRIPEELLGDEVHWLVVLEPGPDRGATALDLIERAGEARPFLRDVDGAGREAPRFTDRLSTKYNRRPLGFHLGPRGGGLDFDLELPAGAVFQADAGLWLVAGLEDLYRLPPRSLLRVSLGRGGAFTPIAETPVMGGGADWRRWTPLEADLSAWAGQRVTLRIELITEHTPAPEDLGYVGSPRIAVRTGS
jgi:hypothetical protein